MTGQPTQPTDDDIALAGEYVLRLLSPEDQAAFQARLLDEPALRGLVAGWDRDLTPLADQIDEVAPPASVRAGIDAALFPKPPRPRGALVGWLGGAVSAVVLGLIAVVLIVPAPPGPVTPPAYTARIETQEPPLVILAELRGAQLQIQRITGQAAPGRTLELWLIADGAAAPVSLGLLDAARIERPLPADLRAGFAGGTLAVSDEPLGGSPTGAPTGAVLALAAISTL